LANNNTQALERSVDEELGTPDVLHDFWYKFIEESSTHAGQVVNPISAERSASVYACIQGISETIAMLPISIFEELDEKTKRATRDHPVFKLLRDPNPWNDDFQFMETMQSNLLTHGNCYAHKRIKRSGTIDRLVPLLPERVEVKMIGERLRYTYTDPDSKKHVYYNDEKKGEVFHVRHRSADGLLGRSPIRVAADTVGFALGALKHGNNLFENGTFLSGLIKSPHAFKGDDERRQFMNSLKEFINAKNTGGLGLLEQGTEYVPFQMTARDAQFLEAREFSVVDIARLFRMPPVMIQAMDKGMSYASIEQLAIFFVQYTILPWSIRWERAINKQLLGASRNGAFYPKFNIKSLIRGDLKSETEAIVSQLQNGLITLNEARALLDENPHEHEIADEILLQHNLRTADQMLAEPEEEVEPEPEDDPEIEAVDPDDVEKEDLARDAFRSLFESTIEKLVSTEVRAIKRAIKKKGFYKWADEYYQAHIGTIRDNLLPIARTFVEILGIDDAETPLEEALDDYLEDRRDFLLNSQAEIGEKSVAELCPKLRNAAFHAENIVNHFIGVKNGTA